MPVLTLQKEGNTKRRRAPISAKPSSARDLLRGRQQDRQLPRQRTLRHVQVEVADGKVFPADPDGGGRARRLHPLLRPVDPENVRLSCRATITGDLTVGTHPAISVDAKLTKERLTLMAIWSFFGGVLFLVVVRMLIEIATGR